jgi:hypothetical protein
MAAAPRGRLGAKAGNSRARRAWCRRLVSARSAEALTMAIAQTAASGCRYDPGRHQGQPFSDRHAQRPFLDRCALIAYLTLDGFVVLTLPPLGGHSARV